MLSTRRSKAELIKLDWRFRSGYEMSTEIKKEVQLEIAHGSASFDATSATRPWLKPDFFVSRMLHLRLVRPPLDEVAALR